MSEAPCRAMRGSPEFPRLPGAIDYSISSPQLALRIEVRQAGCFSGLLFCFD